VNQVDALLLVLLVPPALRGWWRGFCREGFGLAGVLGGALAAAAGAGPFAALLVAREALPPVVAFPAAAAAIFLAVAAAATLAGALVDRLARALLLGGANRAAGAGFGALKGAAVLGFALLLADRLAPSPALAHLIASSTLGPPLMQLASGVLEIGRDLAAAGGRT
jgi:membrane protein required for colicin V production